MSNGLISRQGNNAISVDVGNVTLLVSYDTVVAAFISGIGYVSGGYYSSTTSRHVKDWAGKSYKEMPVVEQKLLDALVTKNQDVVDQIKVTLKKEKVA